jgi:hypothetical protein
MANEKLVTVLNSYFRQVAPFGTLAGLQGDFEAEYKTVFVPYLVSLEDSSRRRLIGLLGQNCVGGQSELKQWRSKSFRLLERLRFPWPEDYRALLREVEGAFVSEFNKPGNLATWASHTQTRRPLAIEKSFSYPLSLYGILLVSEAESRIADSVRYLIESTKDSRFRNQLLRAPKVIDGLQVTKPVPDQMRWFLAHVQYLNRELERERDEERRREAN